MEAIVVVEDDEFIRELLRDALTLFGRRVVRTVADGRAFLETLTSQIPALVVLDVQMPRLDGITAYRRLRERDETREVPVLFLTASPRLVLEADLAGPFEVLSKPFDLATLERQVSHLIGSPAA